MTKILLTLGAVITILCLSCEAAAQSDVALATRQAELQELSETFQKRDQKDRQQSNDTASDAVR